MTPPPAIRNAALAASAGTGKTFALACRYLALLAAGADPSSIVALTFTRKAAGEILSRILTRLAQAADSDDALLELTRDLAQARLPAFPDRPAAQAALRGLVQALPRLRIGTLDAFFLQILRPFRLELGIGADPAIVQPLDAPEDNLILQNLLESSALTGDEQRELLEAFKLATFGEEKKSVYTSIARLVQDQYELLQRAPASHVWGDPARIWNSGTSLLASPVPPDWDSVSAALEAQTDHLGSPSIQKAWRKFIDALLQTRILGDFEFGPALNDRLYATFTSPDADRASIPYGRGVLSLLPETQNALASAFVYLRHAALFRQIIRTQGLHRLLSAYAREHRSHIARTGQLAFNDIARLLAPGQAPSHLRTQLDRRLDARFLHWLLDEFQDTSLLQWSVIENLVDEIIQNPENDRTFFYVGDTKQAIYQWRGGDPRLFRRILAKYNRPGLAAIEDAPPLVRSWRSSPTILDAVNSVFGQLPALPLPDASLADDWREIASRWDTEWQPHEAAPKNQTLSGHVTLHILPRLKKDEDGPTPVSCAADLIQRLQHDIPAFPRLSVALLARGNDEGLALLDALAAKGIRAAWAGDCPLLDNALLPAILSLAKLLEHPGDVLARRHIAMSPLALLPLAPSDLSAGARLVREQGYAGFCARLASLLDLSAAPLERDRLRTLLSIAADYDRQPNPTALGFCSFVQSQTIPAEETGSNIHILTMHKAKGLEFDIVLLPALGKDGITANARAPLLVHELDTSDPIPPVDWILASPAKEILQAEPPLAAQLAADRVNKALEELRLLYVAMTRAKRALHVFTQEPSDTTTTLRLDTLLQQTLAPDAVPHPSSPVFSSGDPHWWSSMPPGQSPAVPPSLALDLAGLPATPAEPPLSSRIASQDHPIGGTKAGWLFRPEGAQARDLGTRIHALFEPIEWLAPGEIPAFPGADPEDRRLATTLLLDPVLHRLFERPPGPVELLREQAFETILDHQWLSGKIDRLQLELGPDGRPCRARIFDFKTDRTPDPARHRPQMDDYRRAVSLLFGLPPARITCTLLFLRSPAAADL